MSAVTQTLSEVLESATGFDEIAVAKSFDGMDLYAGNEAHPMRVPRAVVFLHKRSDGMPDAEAKAFALGLAMRDLNDYFADEPDDVDPEHPDSDSGNDASEPESEPTS